MVVVKNCLLHFPASVRHTLVSIDSRENLANVASSGRHCSFIPNKRNPHSGTFSGCNTDKLCTYIWRPWAFCGIGKASVKMAITFFVTLLIQLNQAAKLVFISKV